MDETAVMAETGQETQSAPCRRSPHFASILLSGFGLLSLVLWPSPGMSAGSSTAAPKLLHEQSVTVVFTARILPRDGGGLASPELRLHLPVNLPQQTIGKPDIEGGPKRLADFWKSPVLVYQRDELKPGEILTGRWSASARIREFQWPLPPPATNPAKELPPKERALYLRDAVAFGLTNPVVRSAAKQACDGKDSESARLDGIFALVMERLQYERDGSWRPAGEVLASGKGSCSEFTYAFVALCRASGIPARYVGGIVGRAGVPFHVDTVFHRYSQAFVDGVGWVDFDPTRTDRAKDRRLYFGRTSPNMVLLCVGDGGEGSLTGWDYLESHRWGGGASEAARIRTAWWFPEPPASVRKAVKHFRAGLAKRRSDPNALVAEALAIGHPFVLPWLDDLLYRPETRVAAARACLKIGGDGALQPVVNSLGRLRDRDGDRQIGAVLDSYAGQTIGGNRAKWQDWLKSRPASARTPANQSP